MNIFDSLKQISEADETSEAPGLLRRSFGQSSTGILLGQGLTPKEEKLRREAEDPGFLVNTLESFATMAADLPEMFAGGAAGTALGGPVGGGAGAFAAPEAIKAGYREYLENQISGKPVSFVDWLKETGKAGALGAVFGASEKPITQFVNSTATKYSGTTFGKFLNTPVKREIADAILESGVLTGAESAINLDPSMLSLENFRDNFIQVGGLKFANRVMSDLKPNKRMTAEELSKYKDDLSNANKFIEIREEVLEARKEEVKRGERTSIYDDGDIVRTKDGKEGRVVAADKDVVTVREGEKDYRYKPREVSLVDIPERIAQNHERTARVVAEADLESQRRQKKPDVERAAKESEGRSRRIKEAKAQEAKEKKEIEARARQKEEIDKKNKEKEKKDLAEWAKENVDKLKEKRDKLLEKIDKVEEQVKGKGKTLPEKVSQDLLNEVRKLVDAEKAPYDPKTNKIIEKVKGLQTKLPEQGKQQVNRLPKVEEKTKPPTTKEIKGVDRKIATQRALQSARSRILDLDKKISKAKKDITQVRLREEQKGLKKELMQIRNTMQEYEKVPKMKELLRKKPTPETKKFLTDTTRYTRDLAIRMNDRFVSGEARERIKKSIKADVGIKFPCL